MFALDIINVFVGILFVVFGYKIRFKGRLDLINGYTKGNMKDEEAYGRWIGGSELICGTALIILGLVGFATGKVSTIALLVPVVVLTLVALLFTGEKRYGKTK